MSKDFRNRTGSGTEVECDLLKESGNCQKTGNKCRPCEKCFTWIKEARSKDHFKTREIKEGRRNVSL